MEWLVRLSTFSWSSIDPLQACRKWRFGQVGTLRVQERNQLSPPGKSPIIGSRNDTNGTGKNISTAYLAVNYLVGKKRTSKGRHRKNWCQLANRRNNIKLDHQSDGYTIGYEWQKSATPTICSSTKKGEMRCCRSKMLFIMKFGCEKYTCTAHNKGFGVMVAIEPVLGICNTI